MFVFNTKGEIDRCFKIFTFSVCLFLLNLMQIFMSHTNILRTFVSSIFNTELFVNESHTKSFFLLLFCCDREFINIRKVRLVLQIVKVYRKHAAYVK